MNFDTLVVILVIIIVAILVLIFLFMFGGGALKYYIDYIIYTLYSNL